jgi:sugar-specific transcriptional regulator TrmB
MFKETLLKAGLNNVQAEILDYLYQQKEAKASIIAQKTKRSRAIVYQELDNLANLGLITKQEAKQKIATFAAGHPSLLKNVMENRLKSLNQAQQSLESSLPDIISGYNLINDKPGVRFFEGTTGLKQIYDEILKENKDIYLVRSIFHSNYEKQIVPIIEEFIKKRVQKNLKVTAITPSDVVVDQSKDQKHLFTRIIVDQEKYNAPVEINIFGNKVAILSFGEELIGMIIESSQIALSLKQLFLLASFKPTKNPAEKPDIRTIYLKPRDTQTERPK